MSDRYRIAAPQRPNNSSHPMTDRPAPAAISGVFADYRLVKTRGVLQLVIEVPVERQAEVFEALGYPMPGEEKPVAVARINGRVAERTNAEVAPAPASDPAPQIVNCNLRDPMKAARTRAVLLCKDERFRRWLTPPRCMVPDESGARGIILDECGIKSRAEIATDRAAYERFLALEARYKADTGQMAEQRG
jgi:hypothetical protein